jgi:hypothetical protein
MKKYFMLLILPAMVLAIWDAKWVDINRWNCVFDNEGRLGVDSIAGSAGGYWPYPIMNYYIFGAGPWIGATIGSDSLATLGYNPNTGGSEMMQTLCQYWRAGFTNPLDRIYQYPGDWPPPSSRFPMAPVTSRAEREYWCCFGDSDPSRHTAGGRPLGIDIALTIYGFSDSIAQDFFFLKYDLMNNNSYTLNNVYFGVVLDGDIGSATDDMVGLIRDHYFTVGTRTFRVRNTGFEYDNNNLEGASATWQSGTPGAVAIRLLSAPAGLNMTAFKIFNLNVDPMTDLYQYRTLAGYNYQTGQYQPFDSVDVTPSDKRMLLSSGPLNLAPLATASFHYAIIAAPYGAAGAPANNRDTSDLALQCFLADSIYTARILGVEEASKPAIQYNVIKISPNPFKTNLYISSSLNQKLQTEIYNANGMLVKTLRGTHITWNGKDNTGHNLPSGIYFLRIRQQNETTTSKVLLIRD